MAEREKIEVQKVIEITSNAIISTYKSQFSKEGNDVKVEFNGEKFVIIDNDSIYQTEFLNSNKGFTQIFSEKIEKSLKNFRKEREYNHFSNLKGDIVSGTIQSFSRNSNYIVNLGDGLGYWSEREWKVENRNNIYLGKPMRFLVLDVKKDKESTNVIITRHNNEFIKKIFEIEIPEIKEGVVILKDIIRIFGVISKVLVKLDEKKTNKKLNPISICIGKNRSRINSISNELGEEKIDLIYWNEDKKKLLINLLSPSEVVSVIEKSDNNWEVVVPNFRISLILQASGKVIKKIEEYLNIKLRIKSFEELENDKSSFVIWNGNISFNEYNEIIKDQKEIKSKKGLYPK